MIDDAELLKLLEEAMHMLRHTKCIDEDATKCPACSLESEIETALQNRKSRLLEGWQPIETAPHSGISLLLYQPWRSGYDTHLIGHYANGWVIHDGGELWNVEPTHWMPLPPAPISETPKD